MKHFKKQRGFAGIIGILVVVALIGFGFVYYQESGSQLGPQILAAPDTHEISGVMQAAESAVEAQNKMTEQTETAMNADGKVMDAKGDVMTKSGDTMMKKGSYEAYAPEKFAKAATGHVVLFFRASWCPTCKALDADIRSHLGSIPADLTILDVNYDDSTALKQKYGVTYQHTFVQVKADGTLIKKWSGSPTLAALVSQVQ